MADAEVYETKQWQAAKDTPLGNGGGGDGARAPLRAVDVCAGVRYSSPAFSAGAVASPLDGHVSNLWMARRTWHF